MPARAGSTQRVTSSPKERAIRSFRFIDGNNTLIAEDDDGADRRFDARISRTQGDTPLPNTLVAGNYFLGLSDIDGDADPFAVDLIGPANALRLNRFCKIGGNVTVSSLKFGTFSDGGTASATFRTESPDLSIDGPLVVGQTGNARFELTGGSTTVSGTTTVRDSDSLIVGGGTFNADGDINIENSGSFLVSSSGDLNANGDINVDGGTLFVFDVGDRLLNPDRRLTATSSALVGTISNRLFIELGQTVNIQSGSDWNHTGDIIAGSNFGRGTISVDGDDSTLNVIDTIELTVGGGRGELNVKNSAQATSNALSLGRNLTANNTDAILNINTGGGLTTGNVLVGDIDGNQGAGTINLDGSGSSLTQTGASVLFLGNIDTVNNEGEHAINVTNGAVLTTGTGQIFISDTGTLTVDETSRFIAIGDITVDGGTFVNLNTSIRQDLLAANGKNLLVTNEGQVETTSNDMFIGDGQTARINSGADWIHTGNLFVGSVNGNGTVTVDGTGSTLNVGNVLLLSDSGDPQRGQCSKQRPSQLNFFERW